MTIRLSRQESARIARLAKAKRVTRSAVVREGLAALEEPVEGSSAFDVWRDAVGVVRGSPRDLATNPRHLKGYGR